MQSRKYQVPGKRGTDRDIGCLAIPDFPHHNHVRILSNDVPESRSEGPMIRRLQLLAIAAVVIVAAFSTGLPFLFYLVYLGVRI